MVTSSKKKIGSYLTHTAAYLCKILLHVHQSFPRYGGGGGGGDIVPPPQCYRALKSPVLIGLRQYSLKTVVPKCPDTAYFKVAFNFAEIGDIEYPERI